MNVELITIIIGFVTLLLAILGLIIAILQINNNLRIEFRGEFDKLENKIDYTNQRIDKVYDVIADLYKTLTKKDAA